LDPLRFVHGLQVGGQNTVFVAVGFGFSWVLVLSKNSRVDGVCFVWVLLAHGGRRRRTVEGLFWFVVVVVVVLSRAGCL